MRRRDTTRNFLLLVAAAIVALAAAAAPPQAAARGHHSIHRSWGGAWGGYAFAPWQFPQHRYAGPFRYYDRFGSNLNPDRQMVGIGE